jgi:uncharacterized protein
MHSQTVEKQPTALPLCCNSQLLVMTTESQAATRLMSPYTAMPELSPIFVDTGYLVALLNRRDGLHDQAVALARKWQKKRRSFVTTDAVLIELANFFARTSMRGAAIAAIQKLRTAPGWTIEHVSPPLLARSEKRYGAHLDKAWSLTDCISMEVMTDCASREVATPDKHFAQAGFRILMG